jgi:hypothetical protein
MTHGDATLEHDRNGRIEEATYTRAGPRTPESLPPESASMHAAIILRRLWRLKAGVALVLVLAVLAGVWSAYDVSVSPFRLTSKSYTFGAARTDLLVDGSQSALADAKVDLKPLSDRALVLSQFLLGDSVRSAIGREAGIPASEIATRGQTNIQQLQTQREAPGEQRATQVLGERSARSVLVRNDQGSPIISLFARGTTPREAERLANGAAAAATGSVAALQRQEHTPERRRVVLRQLGHATGGWVNEGANEVIAALVGTAAFIGGCIVLLLLANVGAALRSARLEASPNSARG